jgi:hypothetical protein
LRLATSSDHSKCPLLRVSGRLCLTGPTTRFRSWPQTGMGQPCLRDAKSSVVFRSWPGIRCRLPGLPPRILLWLWRDRHTPPRAQSSPCSWDGSSSISVAMLVLTGLPDESLASASLYTRWGERGIQKAGPPVSGGCSNIFLFLECRRRRPRCRVPARWPKRLCGQRE